MGHKKNNSEAVAAEEQQNSQRAKKSKIQATSSAKTSLDFRKYTKQIWLAGLGAFSRVEEEGNKLFESLVKVGEELEHSTEQIIEQHFSHAEQRSESLVSHPKSCVDKLLEHSLQHALARLGLVTVQDLHRIESLIIELHQKVDSLAEENQELKKELKKNQLS